MPLTPSHKNITTNAKMKISQKWTKPLARLAVIAILTSLPACGVYEPFPSKRTSPMKGSPSGTEYLTSVNTVITRPDPPRVDNISYWDGNGIAGSPSITVDLSDQKAFFYKEGKLVGVSRISTGREGYNTPSGSFKIIQKNQDHRSSIYGDYVDGSGRKVVADVDVRKDPKPPGATFAGAPMPYFMRIHGGVGMHAGFLPGYAASHGCIRMPEKMARIFFMNVQQGTPVQVVH